MKKLLLLFLTLFLFQCKKESKKSDPIAVTTQTVSKTTKEQKKDHQIRDVLKAEITPTIDGKMDDPAWANVSWNAIDQNWIGAFPDVEDYFGRYKLTWTPEALYVLVEIKDDILYDQYKDPSTLWWDDDCVEIFIDEDNSGGEHQYNNNAFAYHIALDGNVIDMDAHEKPVLLNNHVTTRKITKDNVSIWEFEIMVFEDTYEEGKTSDPVILTPKKKMGFAIAYNDNDSSKERENMMGSVFVPGEDKNQGWINADIFGTIILVE